MKKTKLAAAIILAGFLAAILVCFWRGALEGLTFYPYNTFLFSPTAQFSDFSSTLWRVGELNPYLGPNISVYYPFLNLVAYRSTLGNHPIQAFILYVFLVFMVLAAVTYQFARSNNPAASLGATVTLALLSYPFIFMVDRGNLEGLVFIFLLLFMFFYEREQFMLSAGFLAMAIASKLYPAVFLILYLAKKKYKEFFITLLLTAALSLIPLMFFQGGLVNNLAYLLNGQNLNIPFVVDNTNIVQRGASLFTLFKIIFIETHSITQMDMSAFLRGYLVSAALIGLLVGAYVYFIEKENWKKFALLTFATILLPQFSADYRLMYVFIPFLLLLGLKERQPFDLFYLVLFCLLLIPKQYFYFTNIVSDSGTTDIGLGVALNLLIILSMCALMIGAGLRGWRRERRILEGARAGD